MLVHTKYVMEDISVNYLKHDQCLRACPVRLLLSKAFTYKLHFSQVGTASEYLGQVCISRA